MSLKFRYIPLTFITNEEQIKAQIKNTIILKHFFDLNKSTIKLDKLIEGTQYGYNASALKAGNNKFLRISDITDGKVNWKTVPYCDCSDEETYLLEQEDILIARTGGTTGKSFIIENPPKKSVFAGYLIRIRANKESIPQFLNLFLNSYVYWSQVTSMNKGDFRPSVNASKLKSLLLPKCNRLEQLDAIKISNGETVKGYEFLQVEIDKALDDFERCKEISNDFRKQKNIINNLKQSILQEAIQGKLTEDWRKQNPTIEPATELLKRIVAEKAQLIKEKKIKKEKPLSKISSEEIPFELPENWVWCRLGELYQTTSGGTPLRSNLEYWNGDIKWYKSGELNDGLLSINSKESITEKGLKESSATLFPSGTLLIAMYGATAGKLAVLKNEATTNQAICGFYENGNLSTTYLFNYLLANRAKMVRESWGMSQPNISQTYLRDFVFALPPIEEQKAIVEKVEALMQKCQDLEQEIEKSETNAEMLMQAVLKEAFESKDIKETKVVKLQAKPTNIDFYKRTLLATEIVWQLHKEPTLGHLKLQKLIYLAQESSKMQLPTNFLQQVAGPYDPQMARSLDKQMKTKKWFEYKKTELFKFKPLEKAGEHKTDFEKFFANEKDSIQYIIDTFRTAKSDSIELVGTLYACWNKLIEEKQMITDELISKRFYEWSEEKAKFEKDRVIKALRWMETKGIVPEYANA